MPAIDMSTRAAASLEVIHHRNELPHSRVSVKFKLEISCPCCNEQNCFESPAWSLLQRHPNGNKPPAGLHYRLEVGQTLDLPDSVDFFTPRPLGSEILSFVRTRWECQFCGVAFGLISHRDNNEQAQVAADLKSMLPIELIEEAILSHDAEWLQRFRDAGKKRRWMLVNP
jgi:hypothetical protein